MGMGFDKAVSFEDMADDGAEIAAAVAKDTTTDTKKEDK